MQKLKWTETCFSSCYCSRNLFQARLTEKKFRPASAFTLFCDEVQMLHHLQKFKFRASSIVQVSMSSSTRCNVVFSAGHTHCWSASWGHSVLMTLNTVMPEVLHDLHGLLRTWPVLCVTHLFCLWAALFWMTKSVSKWAFA